MTAEIPEILRSDEVDGASDEVDVLVVGFGMAGACAAVEAAEAGARVLVIDRGGAGGSTSAMAGGHFYLGGGTAVQVATGHADTAEQMYKYLEAASPDPDPEKLRLYCDGSVEHFEWLERQGVRFERSYYPGKAVIQPGTEGLMYTGNEKVWPFRDVAEPAPRGHKVPVPGDKGGARMVIELLEKRFRSLGGEIRYETGATGLVTDRRGGVVGARWRHFTESGVIRAAAVVLTAGGYACNPDMVAAYTSRLAHGVTPLGSTYDDGLGIRMGISAGGATRHMDRAFVSAPFYPPPELLNGIVVNKLGNRFVAEDAYHGRTAAYVFQQPDAVAYLIVDSESVGTPRYGTVPFIDGWESVPEMEQELDLPEGSLRGTLEEYNHDAARGADPRFHKHPDWLRPLDVGPWAAYDLTPGKATYVGFTLGGLRTDVDGAVLTETGNPIAGLHAAGACASNIAQDSDGYSSGTRLGEGSFFGRRAGRHAAGAARTTTARGGSRR
ncbi:FAD-binding protein [Haloactinomyces albus]|uniref:Succinate dehydrogenase/fumarate reductase flavoprotein subunit n=1 Tax=Haloactinomyces albus TaxID=1352928 RepID=A0AAE3ZGW6_9ACTN|nr:FAD-binding protein [Haloactinomyces albus]MDR7303855.1 succinate dehydrogenase/fumarate reductase flavoprotein subunit [Haloactinomyces albus]